MLGSIIFLFIIIAIGRSIFRPWGYYRRPWFGGMWMGPRMGRGPRRGGFGDPGFGPGPGGHGHGGFGGPGFGPGPGGHGGPGRF